MQAWSDCFNIVCPDLSMIFTLDFKGERNLKAYM